VHEDARLTISFQRTLRIPDDGKTYPLPPGFSCFPLRHIEDYENTLPEEWISRGGVLMPMYQREALWLYFSPHYGAGRRSAYPFAVKVYTGKINAVTGKEFQNGLHGKDMFGSKQDYLVTPGQPWLDGYCVEEGTIRQFVAMPLGDGYTAEEQITGNAEWGGIQLVVYPMDADEYERRFPKSREDELVCSRRAKCMEAPAPAMGLAPGGKMKQEIFKDPFGVNTFDQSAKSRCFVHLLNSQSWKAITGEPIPSTPIDEKTYTSYGYPWFDYYDENLEALSGSPILNGLKSVSTMLKNKQVRQPGDDENDKPRRKVIRLGPKSVREGNFWNDSI
jgi:hypothetical protein